MFTTIRTIETARLSTIIDFARGIAILLVLTTHTAQQFRAGPDWSPSPFALSTVNFINLGASGVGLFFVISGFLMEFLYGGRKLSSRKFWARRIGRIYPLWLFWTLFAIAAAYIPIALDPANPTIIYGHALRLDSLPAAGITILHLLFLGILIPTIWNAYILGGWSIQAEMLNYALFMPIQRSRLEITLGLYLAIEIAYLGLRPALQASFPGYGLIFDSLTSSPLWFILGIYLARVRRGNSGTNPLRIPSHILMAACLLVALLLPGPFVAQWQTFAVVALSIAIASFLAKRLAGKRLLVIGKYSYGMYYAHFLFLLPITRGLQFTFAGKTQAITDWLLIPLMALAYLFVLAGSYCVAWLTFRFLEKPVMTWIRTRW